jgi:hypothetical protein
MKFPEIKKVEDDWVDEDDIYSGKTRKLLVEDDELSPEEDGFMEGYEEAW